MLNVNGLTPIWISLKTAFTATVITFFLGILAARWMLTYRGKFQEVIESLLTAPLVLPPTVVGFLLLLLFGKNGWLGQILAKFGVTVIFSWYATVIASTVVAFPLMYKTALAAFQQIDPSLFACARTLGASENRIFWEIMLPLAKPGLIAGTSLAFARALGEFGATLMLAGSIPGKTETIPIAIFFAAEGGQMDRALWLVITTLAISFGVIFGVNYGTQKPKTQSKKTIISQLIKKSSQFLFRNPPKNRNFALDPVELIVDIEKRLPGFFLDVAFTTNREPLGLIGASGAGKSLILSCIAGLQTPDRGHIILNGKVLFDSTQGINLPSRDRNCGLLLQNYALFPHLTVAENIAFGMPSAMSATEIKQEVARQLTAVDLPEFGDRFPEELSGGQQQRVALARAKARNPEIILLDEPFSALDPHLRQKQAKIISQNLTRYGGVTLLVAHDLEEAYRACSNLVVIDRGQAIAKGKKQTVFANPSSYRTARLIGCKNLSRAILTEDKKIHALDWHCQLTTVEPISQTFSHVGIHAHQILAIEPQITDVSPQQPNTFSCWLATASETPNRMNLYLKLNQPPRDSEDFHLQVEVSKDRWLELKNCSLPWKISLQSYFLIPNY